jgi:hypothetical protein
MPFRILLLTILAIPISQCKTTSTDSAAKDHIDDNEDIVFSRNDVKNVVTPLVEAQHSLDGIREKLYDLEDGVTTEEQFDRNTIYPVVDRINDALDVFFKQIYGNQPPDGELAGTLKKGVVRAKIEQLRHNAREFREIRNKIDSWLDMALNGSGGDRHEHGTLRQSAREAKREILSLFADIGESIGEVITLMRSLQHGGGSGGGGNVDSGGGRRNLASCPTQPDILLGFTDGERLTIDAEGVTNEEFCTAFVGYFAQYLGRSEIVRVKLLAGGPLHQPAKITVVSERLVDYNHDLNHFRVFWNVSAIEGQIDQLFDVQCREDTDCDHRCDGQTATCIAPGISSVSARCTPLDARYNSLETRLIVQVARENGQIDATELLTLTRRSACEPIKEKFSACGPGRCSIPICVPNDARYDGLENTLFQLFINDFGQASARGLLEFTRGSECKIVSEKLLPCATGSCRVRSCIPDDARYESLESTIYEFGAAESGEIAVIQGERFHRRSACEGNL